MTNDEAERRLQELMEQRPNGVIELSLLVREHVRNAAEPCCELVYATYAISSVHTFTGKLGQAFIHVATYANHVNLGFNRGTELPDPQKLLTGTGKKIRHVRIDSLQEIEKQPVRDLIDAAVRQGREMAENHACPTPPTIRFV